MQAAFSRIIAFFMSILALLGLVKPSNTNPVELVEGKSIVIDGRDIAIYLASNPSTGYAWSCELKGDSVQFISKDFVKASSDKMILGEGGTDCFKFMAVKEGTTRVIFTYARSWEAITQSKMEIYITVDSQLAVTWEVLE